MNHTHGHSNIKPSKTQATTLKQPLHIWVGLVCCLRFYTAPGEAGWHLRSGVWVLARLGPLPPSLRSLVLAREQKEGGTLRGFAGSSGFICREESKSKRIRLQENHAYVGT